MDIDEIKKILIEGNNNEKIDILSYLCDVFESYNKSIKGFEELLEFLISFTLETQDDDVKDEALEAICKAAVYQDIDKVDFDDFEKNIAEVPMKFLSRYIDILSYTHNRKYLDTILQFRKHENKYVKNAVEEAIIEIGGK